LAGNKGDDKGDGKDDDDVTSVNLNATGEVLIPKIDIDDTPKPFPVNEHINALPSKQQITNEL